MLILAYHGVDSRPYSPLFVRPDRFQEQMRWLSDHYEVVSLQTAVEVIESGATHQSLAVVTFDDGYEDNYENAFPVLQGIGLAACVFLPTEYIGTGKPFRGENLGRALPKNEREPRCMKWDQVMEMRRGGITFGSHTRTHCRLPALADVDLDLELSGSRTDLCERLKEPIEFFSYPFGDLDGRVIEQVRRARYRAAVITPSGYTPANGLFALPRVGVYGHNSLKAIRAKCSAIAQKLRTTRAYWILK